MPAAPPLCRIKPSRTAADHMQNDRGTATCNRRGGDRNALIRSVTILYEVCRRSGGFSVSCARIGGAVVWSFVLAAGAMGATVLIP